MAIGRKEVDTFLMWLSQVGKTLEILDIETIIHMALDMLNLNYHQGTRHMCY